MLKRTLITAGIVLAMGVAFMPKAHAQTNYMPPDNRWFISGMASYPINTGSSGFHGWGGFAGIGKPFTKYFGLELNYQQYYVQQYGVPINQKLLGLDALLFMHRGSVFNPYFEIGVGYTRLGYDSYGTHSGGNDNTGFGTAGIGAFWRVASYFDIRADLRFNGTFGSFDPTDQAVDNFVASVGFAIPLGTPPEAQQQAAPAPNGEADTDGDGVPDNLDQCPGTPPGVKVDSHGCPIDSDNDGVPDYLDQCPNTPPGTKVDVHGCPINAVIKLPKTHFAFNKAILTAEDQRSLDDAAGTLNNHPHINVQVAGYTDSIGTKAYNLGLSRRRANAVKTYLVQHGVDSSRMTTHGYGESDPVAPNRMNGHDNPAGRAKNRRVELHVMKSGNMQNNGMQNQNNGMTQPGTMQTQGQPEDMGSGQ